MSARSLIGPTIERQTQRQESITCMLPICGSKRRVGDEAEVKNQNIIGVGKDQHLFTFDVDNVDCLQCRCWESPEYVCLRH